MKILTIKNLNKFYIQVTHPNNRPFFIGKETEGGCEVSSDINQAEKFLDEEIAGVLPGIIRVFGTVAQYTLIPCA